MVQEVAVPPHHILCFPGAPAYHIGLELLWETGSSGWILPNFIYWPNHDGQWCSQTWAVIMSLSPVGTDDSLSFITVKRILELWSSLHGHNSNPSIITLFQRWPHSHLLSCGRISPGPNADLFYDEARCIQVQSSDVAAVIVWLIPIFAHNEGSDVKNRGRPRTWIKTLGWYHALEIILNNHRYVSKAIIRWKWRNIHEFKWDFKQGSCRWK